MVRKKIGLVFGGGGAKGFAHVGVLKVLEKYNISIDMVSGTSMGSIVGALHCLGYSAIEMENLIKTVSWRNLFDLNLPKTGLIKGVKVEKFLREIFKNKTFSELNKPFFVTATDILNKQEIVFNKGDVTKAVRASISIPGVFNPVENNGRILVDGGVLDNLPIEILKKNGAEIIIAVNLENLKEKKVIYEKAIVGGNDLNLPSIFTIISSSINLAEQEMTRVLLSQINEEIILNPDVEEIGYKDFQKSKIGIEKGVLETEKRLKDILGKTRGEGFFDRFKNFFKKIF